MLDIQSQLYQAELAKQQAMINGVLKILDKEKKALQELLNSYSKKKSDMETVVSTVTALIDDEIDKLRKANDERNKALQLEKAKADLERANSQKTNRVYVEGKLLPCTVVTQMLASSCIG